jgi:hypothetical protein
LIPLDLTTGQIAWSVVGSENKVLTGRSEQISLSNGIASTYACYNPCGNTYHTGWVDPLAAEAEVGSEQQFVANEVDVNAYGNIMPSFIPDGVSWDSSDWNIASVDSFGLADALDTGSASIEATWEAPHWWLEGTGVCDYVPIIVVLDTPIEAVTVTITKDNDSELPNPFRIGVNGGGHDRTQHLKATITPAAKIASFSISVSPKVTLSNVVKHTDTGIINFDVVGNSASSSSGDSWIRATGRSVSVTKSVSVVVPSKVATPHDTSGSLVVGNRVLNGNTSPAVHELPKGYVALTTIYVRFLTITVTDQFDNLIGDIYQGATITETIQGQIRSINQTLGSTSTYLDPCGSVEPRPNESVVPEDDPLVTTWPTAAQVTLTSKSNSPIDYPVQVDGLTLSPGLSGRTYSASPPNTILITWPN